MVALVAASQLTRVIVSTGCKHWYVLLSRSRRNLERSTLLRVRRLMAVEHTLVLVMCACRALNM